MMEQRIEETVPRVIRDIEEHVLNVAVGLDWQVVAACDQAGAMQAPVRLKIVD